MPRLVIQVLLLIVLTGCVRSLQPFYTDAQVTYEPTVVGTWADTKHENTLVITGNTDDHLYNVAHIDDKGKIGHFIVHLAKVDQQMLADVFPDELKSDDSEEYKAHLIPAHTFMLVAIKPDELRVRLMDADWLKKYLAAHSDAIPHQDMGHDALILTGTTEQVQAFAIKNIATPDAYGEETVLTRLAATRPTTQP